MFIILQKKNGVFICVGFYRVSKMFCFQCVQFGFIVLILIIFLSKFTIYNSKSNLTNVGKKKLRAYAMSCKCTVQLHRCTFDVMRTYTYTHVLCSVSFIMFENFSIPSITLYLFLSKNYSRFFRY